MAMSDLVARLRKELPTVDERESVWCSVQGYDLREAVTLLESLSAQVVQLRGALADAHTRIDRADSIILRLTMDHNSTPNYVAGFDAAQSYFHDFADADHARAALQGQQGAPE